MGSPVFIEQGLCKTINSHRIKRSKGPTSTQDNHLPLYLVLVCVEDKVMGLKNELQLYKCNVEVVVNIADRLFISEIFGNLLRQIPRM